ncbi:MAG: hypothetical protein U9Q83_04240 [Bacteroidota bacterium]|nr:hypothetical protein [Bacteroidota bacterium]
MLRRNKDIAKGYKDESYPPIPTRGTLFIRRCFFIQLFRLLVLNFKIMRIIVGGHK